MRHISIFKTLLICILLSGSQIAALSATADKSSPDPAVAELKEGIQKYSQGAYPQANHWFTLAVEHRPGDAYSNYWSGLTHMQLKEYAEALHEFEAAKSLDKQGIIAGLADKGIATINNLNSQWYSVHYNSYGVALHAALNRIDNQTRSEQQQALSDGESLSNATVVSAEYAAAHNTRSPVNAPIFSPYVYTQTGQIVQAGASDISRVNPYSTKINNLSVAAADAAARANASANETARNLSDSADTLTQQLSGANLPTGLKLSPVGTDLHTRNYESTGSRTAPSQANSGRQEQQQRELLASPERLILDPYSRGGQHPAPGASLPASAKAGTKVDLQVKGTLRQPQ